MDVVAGENGAGVFDSDSVFCANPECVLHVWEGSRNVEGLGNWAEIDGIIYDRHPVKIGGASYCGQCRKELFGLKS